MNLQHSLSILTDRGPSHTVVNSYVAKLMMDPIAEEEGKLFEETFTNKVLKKKKENDSGICEDDLKREERLPPLRCESLNNSDDDDEATDAGEFVSGLPDEIWLKILSHLSNYELCQLSLTCRDLLRLSRDPGLWTRVSLIGDAVSSTHTVSSLFSRTTSLVTASITARDDISDLISSLAQSCPHLRSLEIKFCQPLTFTDLATLTAGCSKIETLNLEGTGTQSTVMFLSNHENISGCYNCDGDSHEMEGSHACQCGPNLSFPQLFSRLSNLRDLNLFHCRNLHSRGLETLAESCPHLERLNIDEINYLTDHSVNTFLELRGETIKMLWIDGESLSDASFSNFDKMTSLELLSVSFADNLGEAGLLAVSRLARLEWLRLRRGADLAPHHFVTAFNSGHLGNLVHLDLSECSRLDDAGVMAIASHCPNLGTLTLAWCWEVTDLGILCVVNKCRFLINLNLCGVVRLLGDFIPNIASGVPGLKLLDLEQCPDIELSDLQLLLTIKKVVPCHLLSQ